MPQVDETNPDSNVRIAQLLELLVEQSVRGNGQSSSSRGPHYDDSQERFRRQKPKEFSGTTDPLVAESWVKSMEVIFEYLQIPDLDRPRCAIYMLRGDAMIWWDGAKLFVDLANLAWEEFKRVFFEQYFCNAPKSIGPYCAF
ncbi:hypothetical protein F511_29845 [Dorcoceras hygrometricum]|uniref:Retrotransposon gag domain-containing protein n=1 Tax=Dorcoceras hygrometricum TaxID=472368 RepID=A0A2Z7D2K7_9LAMI|nr:hypothetical protein F511_29845 [Dorcoceras hygrometricum]